MQESEMRAEQASANKLSIAAGELDQRVKSMWKKDPVLLEVTAVYWAVGLDVMAESLREDPLLRGSALLNDANFLSWVLLAKDGVPRHSKHKKDCPIRDVSSRDIFLATAYGELRCLEALLHESDTEGDSTNHRVMATRHFMAAQASVNLVRMLDEAQAAPPPAPSRANLLLGKLSRSGKKMLGIQDDDVAPNSSAKH